MTLNRRSFIKGSLAIGSLAFIPSSSWARLQNNKLRTAHIGVGGMGAADLDSIASHPDVMVTALCDVDASALADASQKFGSAKTFIDYRKLIISMQNEIDAVIISTPDHTHAPATFLAMDAGKHVYCQKPLTHYVEEARGIRKVAEEKDVVTQMGIQIHSFKEYRSAVELIQSGLIGKVHTVRAWSPKNWGFDGPEPAGKDKVPEGLDWNLWLGTARKRPYKKDYYHPGNWRKLLDYGCGTLGDMGVHILDTPYAALDLDVPASIINECRAPNGFGHPEKNVVTYEFPGTSFTTETLKWVWYDGEGAPSTHPELALPKGELPEQGSMFIGEKGRLLLPHWDFPKLIVDGKYEKVEYPELEEKDHYHEFVDASLGKTQTSAPFSYASRLTEAILLGVVANRFPGEKLTWNNKASTFEQEKANQHLSVKYRQF